MNPPEPKWQLRSHYPSALLPHKAVSTRLIEHVGQCEGPQSEDRRGRFSLWTKERSRTPTR